MVPYPETQVLDKEKSHGIIGYRGDKGGVMAAIYVVFCFDYPREGANAAPGGLYLDSVYEDETKAQFRAGELAMEHDEGWVEPQFLNESDPNLLISLADSTLTLHMTAERMN